MISVKLCVWFGGVCMADGISELWRVGWRPSTSSITQWWTWEAGAWQVVVYGEWGVHKDRSGEGSVLPQRGDWSDMGGSGEKCGQDWGQSCMIGVLYGPQLASKCLCDGQRWIIWLVVGWLECDTNWSVEGYFVCVMVLFTLCGELRSHLKLWYRCPAIISVKGQTKQEKIYLL